MSSPADRLLDATPAAPRIGRARELRREMTGPERHLWEALRSRSFAALKFRRQVPIGRYFVDFFAPARQLVIELDGESHIDRGEYDRQRQRWLESQGLRVLRFANDDVLKELDAVLGAIPLAVGSPGPGRSEGPRPRHPSSGPSGHLLPQGEKARKTSRGPFQGGSR